MKHFFTALLVMTILFFATSFIVKSQNQNTKESTFDNSIDIYWSQFQIIKSKSNFAYCSGLEEFVAMINKSEYRFELDSNNKFINDLIKGSKTWNPSEPNFTINYLLSNKSAIIKGKLNKSVPFKNQFKLLQNGFNFKGSKVNGIYPEYKEDINISCFIDNDNFLFSTENQTINDQIFFMKTSNSLQSPYQIMNEFTKLENKGKEYRKYGYNDWRHIIEGKDSVILPVINITSKGLINEIINTNASINNLDFRCSQAMYECNFVLNEKGSKVKVDYIVAYAAAAWIDEVIDKKLILNDDFYIILKNKKQTKPYMIFKIVNDKFLSKYKK